MTHIDDVVLGQLRDGALAPADVLQADDHLAGCAICRARLAALVAEDQPLAAFVAEVDAYAAGRPPASAIGRLAAGRFAIGPLAAGLAAALVVGVGAWWLTRGVRPEGGAAVIAAASAAPAGEVLVDDNGRRFALGANGQLLGADGLAARDSAWMVDALRGVTLRGLTAEAAGREATEARRVNPGAHLLIGALEEQAGDRQGAADAYRALVAENPGSAVAADRLARVTGHP